MGHLIINEGLENLVHTRHTECKKDRMNQRVTYPARKGKWIAEHQLQDIKMSNIA